MDDRGDHHSLILSHEWVVGWAVRRSGRRLEQQEAWQEGWVALVGAAAEWDGQGRFADFAAPRVRVAIRRARRRRDRVWKKEWADQNIGRRAVHQDGDNVDTEAMVLAAMGEALCQEEREAIRRFWLKGEGGGSERERRLRRRAEAKLRKHLAG